MSIIGGVNFGDLLNNLFFFNSGVTLAKWVGSSKGYIGNVVINGITANETSSGTIPYAGTISTNDTTLGNWQSIVTQNASQATSVTNATALVNSLSSNLISALQQINNLPATPGFTNISSLSLDGLNTQNGINEIFVINITSDFAFSSQINITGDAGDVFIFRWDTDANPINGYQGQVKIQSGGAFVPKGGLTPANFIHVAGEINSTGGGTNPPSPYPQGPRYNNGQGNLITGGTNFVGGGFFSGYWLTTGKPEIYDSISGLYYGSNTSLNNAIFVGGLYSLTTSFTLTSGTSAVYISPNPSSLNNPNISIKKYVSVNNGSTWVDAETSPGPSIIYPTNPKFKYVVTNTGNVKLTNISTTDNIYGTITLPTTTLEPNQSTEVIITGTWQIGNHENIATVSVTYANIQYTNTDYAHFYGEKPEVRINKYVSPDNGNTWLEPTSAPGPDIPNGINPEFKYIITNTGNVTLTSINLVDNVYGTISIPTTTLNAGNTIEVVITKAWQPNQHTNTATVSATYNSTVYSNSATSYYYGAIAAIDLKKYVSPNNGLAWINNSNLTIPYISKDIIPQFKFIVSNPSNVILTNIILVDNVYGNISIPTTTLLPNQSFEVIITKPWQQGQHTNTATVTGTYNNNQYTNSNTVKYLGIDASIQSNKYVSLDNGISWFDTSIPPGSNISAGVTAKFKYVITNNGSITLSNFIIIDSTLDIVGIIHNLEPGSTYEFYDNYLETN